VVCIVCGLETGEHRVGVAVWGHGLLSDLGFSSEICPACWETVRRLRAQDPEGSLDDETVKVVVDDDLDDRVDAPVAESLTD